MEKSKVSGIVLAAGASSRMQKNKILLPLGEKTVIETIIETLLKTKLSEVIVIGGRSFDLLSDKMKSYPVTCVENKHYLEGQSTSMQLGLSKIKTDAEGCFFFMGDQPLIDTENIEDMIDIFAENKNLKAIITPMCSSGRGTPVLFGSAWFKALNEVKGDQGGRSIINEASTHVIAYPVKNESFFWDIDDEQMYQHVLKHYNQGVSNERD